MNLAHADGEMHMVFNSAGTCTWSECLRRKAGWRLRLARFLPPAADPTQIAVVAFMIEMSADATTQMLETAFAQLDEIPDEGSSTTVSLFALCLAAVRETLMQFLLVDPVSGLFRVLGRGSRAELLPIRRLAHDAALQRDGRVVRCREGHSPEHRGVP